MNHELLLADSKNEQTTLTTEQERQQRFGHTNPIDASEVTDEERAGLLDEWLSHFEEEFGERPMLMPLGEGKDPIIKNKCRLDSSRGRNFLCHPDEALRRMRNGERGFCVYGGKESHNTEDAVFVDHDDTNEFPAPTGKPTLEVLSGSGRGSHETYRNDAENPIRNAKAGVNNDAGEIRAHNLYVLVPGSIHPSGGVYHTVEERSIDTISDNDLSDEQRPSSTTSGQPRTDKNGKPILPEVEDASFRPNTDGEGVGEIIGMVRMCRYEFMESLPPSGVANDRLQEMIDGKSRNWGFVSKDGSTDRSEAEYNLFGLIYGMVLEHGDVSKPEAIEATGQYMTHVFNDGQEWTQDGLPRKWLRQPGDYRKRTASIAVRNFDRRQWETWREATGKEDDDYSWKTYNLLLLAARNECMEGGDYNPEHYPRGRLIREKARSMDDNPRSKTTYRLALSRLVNEHRQLKMACMKEYQDYRYYPTEAPNPEQAEYIKFGGKRIKPQPEKQPIEAQ